jgi:hypothetical protein
MDAYDRAICRAFAYKVKTHTSDQDFQYIPFAFTSEPLLPSLSKIHSRIGFLSGYKPELYDCCPSSCCCYLGPYAELTACPFCKENRYQRDGKPRKRFTYIPIIPRLIAFARNKEYSTKMQYRHQYCSTEARDSISADIFDGTQYKKLCETHITVDTKTLPHKYFSDSRDIALGLSTDGFAPFNKRKKTAWPLLVFNYNLPPDIRFHAEHLLSLGVIPGPKKPKDADSFLWPFLQELFRLAYGVKALDMLAKAFFLLRAFLIVVFGDIPAMSMLMRMKGHNGFSPCRICEIKGVRIPGDRSSVHYVPLNRATCPHIQVNGHQISRYDPRELPLRMHSSLLQQARKVEVAKSGAKANDLAKEYGIKGTPLLSYAHSLSFPQSFPYDFMHLIWENLIPNLILHWTGNFKGLDEGGESYQLAKEIWETIGTQTLRAGTYIPSAYGGRVPDIAQDKTSCTAETWSFWTQYIGPVLLRNRFRNAKYYQHFVALVSLLNRCLQFEISKEEIEELRQGFVKWVEDYETCVIFFSNLLFSAKSTLTTVTTTRIIHVAYQLVHLRSTHFYTLPTASQQWGQYGATGPFQWNAIVAVSSFHFVPDGFLMHHWIDMSLKMHS